MGRKKTQPNLISRP